MMSIWLRYTCHGNTIRTAHYINNVWTQETCIHSSLHGWLYFPHWEHNQNTCNSAPLHRAMCTHDIPLLWPITVTMETRDPIFWYLMSLQTIWILKQWKPSSRKVSHEKHLIEIALSASCLLVLLLILKSDTQCTSYMYFVCLVREAKVAKWLCFACLTVTQLYAGLLSRLYSCGCSALKSEVAVYTITLQIAVVGIQSSFNFYIWLLTRQVYFLALQLDNINVA